MDLYVYDNYKGNKESEISTNQLINLALKQYGGCEDSGSCADYDTSIICRTKNGKPYIDNFPVHFSVSHSDNVWICLIGETENGVDIQRTQHNNYNAISRRFYSDEEQRAVEIGGQEAFTSIWCRKEAFIKYFGLTLGETLEWLSVAENRHPADRIEFRGNPVVFTDIKVKQDYQCVAATGKKEQICIKKLRID